ncbi:A24 family peptidase [Oceanirhabdus sp. W0125-5]|uniref:A24 family peptidase n=1 Tax=Oceanirhabdus sp. W0125-5 TaxID=2999116 RepID=UPI0022F30CB1|nr:A24 family peptidase [Oceanirhabdus sp. W0125-5]WBW95960.1 A24 family peptidase [Oceanirhabdus sp. W0125-5]
MNIIILSILLIFSVIKDISKRTIPNKLLAPFIIIGIAFSSFENGIRGGFDSLGAVMIVFLFFLIPFALGWIGGGDVKLLMTVGTFIGSRMVITCIIYTIIVGALYGVVMIIKGKRIKNLIEHYKIYFLKVFLMNSFKEMTYEMENPEEDERGIPYSIPIAIGTILTLI